MMATTASPLLNCSLALPPTPAPSQTCLKEEVATASPSSLGGGLSSVVITRAIHGLQATQVGPTSSLWGESVSIFHNNQAPNLQREEIWSHSMDAALFS